MSDDDGEIPDTGAGVGRNDVLAAGLGTEDDAGDGSPAPLHVGETSVGGELNEPATSKEEVQNMNPGANVSPSEQGPAISGVSTPALDASDPVRLAATTVQIEDLSDAPRGALTRQGDVGGPDAPSAPMRTTGPDVSQTSREAAARAATVKIVLAKGAARAERRTTRTASC